MSCCSSFARTMTNVYPCSFWRNPCILCYPLSYVSSRYTKQWTRILHWLEWNCFVASHYYGIRKNAKLISLCQTTLKNALNKFQHPQPAYPQHALHKHMPKRCGTQYLPQDDKDAPLSNPQSKWVEEIVCMLLHYSHAVNPTLACALSSITTKQTHGTTLFLQACHHLLDCVAIHPHAAITYVASNMIFCAFCCHLLIWTRQ